MFFAPRYPVSHKQRSTNDSFCVSNAMYTPVVPSLPNELQSTKSLVCAVRQRLSSSEQVCWCACLEALNHLITHAPATLFDIAPPDTICQTQFSRGRLRWWNRISPSLQRSREIFWQTCRFGSVGSSRKNQIWKIKTEGAIPKDVRMSCSAPWLGRTACYKEQSKGQKIVRRFIFFFHAHFRTFTSRFLEKK